MASSSAQKQDHRCSTRDRDPPAETGDMRGEMGPKAEEAPAPEAPSSDPRLREELCAAQQIARELKNALESETANSHALRFLLEDLKTSHATSQASSEIQIKQLREEIVRLRELEIYQKEKEVCLQGEIQHVTEESSQLRAMKELQEQRKVEEMKEMKDTIERLLLERQQLTAKIVEMQMGMNQLEREAVIRTCVENELAVATTTPEASKRWLSWTPSEGSVAEAATVAEGSMVAAATMMEKLVAENSALAEKVNEQSALIDRLTEKYSYVMGLQSNGHVESIEFERDACSTPLADQVVVEENTEAQAKAVSTVDDDVQSEKIKARMEAVPPIDDDSVAADDASNFDDTGQEASKSFLHDPTPHNSEMHANDLKPFSDAPIMGAPIRLFAFIARYVSGADLVENSN